MISLAQLQMRLGDDLRTVTGHRVAQRNLSGVHISELDDPTPYLEGGELLLTTGIPVCGSADTVRAYVHRLVDRKVGALGLGLGAGVDRVPPELLDACSEAGLELLLVPDGVPFMNVSRAYWDLVATEGQTDLVASLGTQTALARAATLPDAIPSVVKALARALDGWAVYLPADGRQETLWPPAAHGVLPQLRQETARLNRGGGTHSAATFQIHGTNVVEYPVLVGRRVAGFLAIGSGRPLAKADRQVVLTVCVLLALKAQQEEGISSARVALHSAVAKLFVAGHSAAGHTLAADLGISVPAGQVRLLVLRGGADVATSAEAAEVLAGLQADEPWDGLGERVRSCRLWFTTDDMSYFLIDADTALASSQPPATPAGPAGRVARDCSAVLSPTVPLHRVAEVIGEMVELVRNLEAGRRVIKPGRTLDPRAEAWVAALHSYARADLTATVRSYLRHRGQWEAAARELDVHRNSLRHRIGIATNLIKADLDDPDVAANLWLALR